MPKHDVPSRLDMFSDLQNLRAIEPFLQKFCTQHCLCANTYYDLHLVLTEAATNCIKHGNQFDKGKKVSIELQSLKCGKLLCSIKDEGVGFDPSVVPDPTHPSRINRPHGRGLMLIKAIAQTVEYTQGGRCCIVEFQGKIQNQYKR